jgi:hypothetical protein
MRLAFTGKKQSGKTTAAQSLQKWGSWRIMSFADPIKDLAVQMTNMAIRETWRYHELANRDGRNYAFSRADLDRNKDVFRPFLQWLGTEFGRDFLGNPEIWNWHMEDRIDLALGEGHHIVIDDCRYLNEAEWLRREGFSIVRISRPGLEDDDMHASEKELELIEVDDFIVNDWSVDDLARSVAALVVAAAVP